MLVESQRRGDLDIPELPTYNIPPPTRPARTTKQPTTTKATTPKIVTYAPFPKSSSEGDGKLITATVLSSHLRSQSTTDKPNKLATKYNELDKPVAEVEKSVDRDTNMNYIVAGTAAGVVALIGALATTLGVLASKGFFAPKGFTPVETTV